MAEAAQPVDRKIAADAVADPVDEASDESFPASDPPSWDALRAGAPDSLSKHDNSAESAPTRLAQVKHGGVPTQEIAHRRPPTASPARAD